MSVPPYKYKGCTGIKYGRGSTRATKQRDINGGFYDSVFMDKDSPDYRPNYGRKYTERQIKIIQDEIPLDEVRLNELSIILRKAENIEDEPVIRKIQKLRKRKTYLANFQFTFTEEEAIEILKSLTPWESD